MKLLIAGAGGHGRVVGDAAIASGVYKDVQFLDDRLSGRSNTGNWQIVGKLNDLAKLASKFDGFVAAFGDATLRLKTLALWLGQGRHSPAIVHPSAAISRHASIGEGSVVLAGAVVNIGARIGIGCIINSGATVDHDCVLADGVHVCPGANVAGNVFIGQRTWFGIGAVAKQGIQIGADAIIGAGAVVIDNVIDGAKVVGNPARVLET